MQRQAIDSTSSRAQHALKQLGALTTLVLAPVAMYVLGALAWEQAQALSTSGQLTATAGLSTLSLGAALTPAAAAAGSLVAAHLTWTALALVAMPRTSRLRAAVSSVTPSAWRRLVTVAATGALSAGFALPATAAVVSAADEPTHAGWASHSDQFDPSVANAGWVPAPATAAIETQQPESGKVSAAAGNDNAAPASASATSRAEGNDPAIDAEEVVVKSGDTLWDITARQLDLTPADNAAIAAAWPELYHENRTTIGADPGLILPGQQLSIPAGWSA